ncbi:winged helix-turn-helix transcriptional regulator [Gluconacetobacter sp. Hr-1-5]|uniref:LexA family protein n=1 Tax=Gluconacetobacter sp. Hr-1-5 TaxID=3395370 RepID=UPI003B519928
MSSRTAQWESVAEAAIRRGQFAASVGVGIHLSRDEAHALFGIGPLCQAIPSGERGSTARHPKLTATQRRILDVVMPSSGGFDPRTDQVAHSLGVSTSTVWGHLRALERKGIITRSHNAPIRWRKV